MDFMLSKPISKVVSKMAVPTVISMLVMSIYSLADMFFVSKLGTDASAAVGIVFSILTMIQAVGFMLGIGAGSLISRSLGAGNSEEKDSIASVAFFASIIGGFFVLILGILFKTEVMQFLGATSTILPKGNYDHQTEMEKYITDEVNKIGVGPLGLGGDTSVLATFMKVGPQRASGVRVVALRPCCCFEPRVASVEL